MSQASPVKPLDETTPSLSPEISPIPQSPIEDSDQVTLISSFPVDTPQSNSSSSDTLDIHIEKTSNTQTVFEHLPDNESSSVTMVVVTSPSFGSDLTSEQNESLDEINPSSISFLQTDQRRIDHRRNKSEPVTPSNLEDLPLTTTTFDLSSTSNEPSSNNNTSNETKRKSSIKTPSPSTNSKPITQEKSSPSSTTTTRKKKPWYNVSISCFYYYYFKGLFSTFSFL